MTSFLDVIARVAPRRTGDLRFIGDSLLPQKRIFGGQVVAQCLMAADQTVESRFQPHSLHAYFLRAGDPEVPIEFDVDPIRDGRSFTTRRVVARQHGEAIFNTSISYHVAEDGVWHCVDMPEVQPPHGEADDLSQFQGFTTKPGDPSLIEMYQIERQRVTEYQPEPQPPIGLSWFRAVGPLPDDPAVHRVALTMISDYSLLSTVFYPHPYGNPIKRFMAASLDHAIWFHHVGKMDEWVLYACDSPRSGGGRGFSRGALWSQDGTLLASTAQESLVRLLKRD